MAVPNEVKLKVRRSVLLLKTFTIPQLVSITGLNRQSIHTEVGRMADEELIIRLGTETKKRGPQGGRPAVLYQLSPDPEKRFEILQSVRAFYTAEDQTSELPRPESKHYFLAKEDLEEAGADPSRLTEAEKVELLTSVRERLEYARREEETDEEGTELIAAALDMLEAKAVYLLASDWERAIALLDEACRVCRQVGADDLVAEAHADVQTIVDQMAEEQLELEERGAYETVEEIFRDLRVIRHRFGDLSGISRVVNYAERLAMRVRERQAQEKAEQLARIRNAYTQERAYLITNMEAVAIGYEEIGEGYPRVSAFRDVEVIALVQRSHHPDEMNLKLVDSTEEELRTRRARYITPHLHEKTSKVVQ